MLQKRAQGTGVMTRYNFKKRTFILTDSSLAYFSGTAVVSFPPGRLPYELHAHTHTHTHNHTHTRMLSRVLCSVADFSFCFSLECQSVCPWLQVPFKSRSVSPHSLSEPALALPCSGPASASTVSASTASASA